ncbi:MFS transporter [Liquorilactobacillus vini]|nr:MFS transporter [Liquorilactobacillus vini]
MSSNLSFQNKIAILSASLLSFMGILIETSMNVTFPTLIKELGVSLGTVQWVTTGYLLLVTITMSTTSYLLKRFPAKKLFLFAISCCLTGTIICGLADSFGVLMFGRALQAISTGISTPLLFHLIFSLVPTQHLGFYTGFASMIISFAPALGPTYGGTLNNFYSWHSIFWVALPLIIIIMYSGYRTIELPFKQQTKRFDFRGFTLLAGILVALSLAVNQAGQSGIASWRFITILLIGLVLIGILIVLNQHGQFNLLNLSILKDRTILLSSLVYFFLQFTNIGISFVIPVLAQNTLKTTSMVAGLILLPGSLLGAIVAPLAGRLYDRKGFFLPVLLSNLSLLLGTWLFYILTDDLTVVLITVIYVFLRVGFNLGFGNLLSDASKQVTSEHKPDLNSLFNTLQQYAGSMGTGVLAAVIADQELQPQSLAIATQTGSQRDFLVLVGLSCFNVIAVLMIQHWKQSVKN